MESLKDYTKQNMLMWRSDPTDGMVPFSGISEMYKLETKKGFEHPEKFSGDLVKTEINQSEKPFSKTQMYDVK